MLLIHRRFVRLSPLALAAVAFVVFFSGSAFANPILVNNAGFETLSSVPLMGCNGANCMFNYSSIPGWINDGVDNGQFQPGTPSNFIYFNTAQPDGSPTVAYSNSGTISQTVGVTVQTGMVYTLLVDFGRRNVGGFGAEADLLINGIQYQALGLTPALGNWGTYTATYTALAADLGKTITIELRTSGIQGDFDNVRLSDAVLDLSAPEPQFAGLVGLALAGLLAFSRRKRAA